MPETPVNKHSETFLPKHEIWVSVQLSMPPPPPDPVLAQLHDKCPFRGSVAGTPNSSHDCGSLLHGEYVRHFAQSRRQQNALQLGKRY